MAVSGASGLPDAAPATASWARRRWTRMVAWTRAFAHHRDPLVEAANWVAILIGTHLPFWPLYVRWSAGPQAFPTALWTAASTPLFLAIPLLSRHHGMLGRIATSLAGIANAIFTTWILGLDSGTMLFLGPCAVLSAFLFRRDERWLMIALTLLPLLVYFGLRHVALEPLHRYDADAARSLFVMNAISVAVIVAAFGWLQGDVYAKMEPTGTRSRDFEA